MCRYCLEGRHVRCRGRNDCGCPTCIARAVSGRPVETSEWADGALIDPTTWRRVALTELDGIEWCTAHDEPHIEAHDTPQACRDAEDHECEICEGNGYQVDPVGDSYDCVDCDSTGMEPGYTACTLVPLYTLTPAPEEGTSDG